MARGSICPALLSPSPWAAPTGHLFSAPAWDILVPIPWQTVAVTAELMSFSPSQGDVPSRPSVSLHLWGDVGLW